MNLADVELNAESCCFKLIIWRKNISRSGSVDLTPDCTEGAVWLRSTLFEKDHMITLTSLRFGIRVPLR